MEDLVQKICGFCGKKRLDLFKCAACKSVWYCNVQCQKKAWKSHKDKCRKERSLDSVNRGEAHSSNSGQAKECHAEVKVKQFIQDDLIITHAKECALCGETGIKLKKCGACMSVKYCSTVCQKTDWVNHEKVCGVIKVYPKMYPLDTYNIGINCLTGTFTKSDRKKNYEKFIGKEEGMVVKIQTSLNLETALGHLSGSLNPKPSMRVYNESNDYDVMIENTDRNYDTLYGKILNEGLSCINLHPRLKKLYCKAYLNSDFSLDLYLKCTYTITDW